MIITGIAGFNEKWAASLKEGEFLREMQGEGYAHILAGDPKRTAKLKEVHKLCREKVNPPPEPENED
jgi:hypothetical protein